MPAFHVDVAAASGAIRAARSRSRATARARSSRRTSVTLGGVNQWMTVALTAEVDQVVLVGQTGGSAPSAPTTWAGGSTRPRASTSLIDVRPGNAENPVNPGSNGVLPVALLGSESFDVMDVDPDSLALGVNGAPAVEMEYADANGDGSIDLVAHYQHARHRHRLRRHLDLPHRRDARTASSSRAATRSAPCRSRRQRKEGAQALAP